MARPARAGFEIDYEVLEPCAKVPDCEGEVATGCVARVGFCEDVEFREGV